MIKINIKIGISYAPFLYAAMSLTVYGNISYCMQPYLVLYAVISHCMQPHLSLSASVSYCMRPCLLLYAAMSFTVATSPSLASECAPSPSTQMGGGGGGHTRLRDRGWGSPNSDDWRKA